VSEESLPRRPVSAFGRLRRGKAALFSGPAKLRAGRAAEPEAAACILGGQVVRYRPGRSSYWKFRLMPFDPYITTWKTASVETGYPDLGCTIRALALEGGQKYIYCGSGRSA